MINNKKVYKLLKFGRSEHIKSFAHGDLYFSNARTFWDIENNLSLRGQGDLLEGSSKLFARNMTMLDRDNLSMVKELQNCCGIVRYESAEEIPLLCLFIVFEDDCVFEANGNTQILLNEEVKEVMQAHFPNADSVAIIDNPEQFLCDVRNSISDRIEHGIVSYFHISEGYISENGQPKIDLDYMKYLTQDIHPTIKDNKRIYSFNEKYVYRALMCKDTFFEKEQEYRIILPNKKITHGTVFHVNFTTAPRIMSIEDLFSTKVK